MQPKSTAEHMRDGTYEPSRHAERMDRDLATGEPEPLRGLDADAMWLWNGIVETLPDGAKSKLDSSTLAGMCRWFSRWVKYDKALDELEESGHDPKAEWTLFCKMSGAWKQFCVLAGRFGLTPADRTKLKDYAGSSQPKEDPLAELLSKRSAN